MAQAPLQLTVHDVNKQRAFIEHIIIQNLQSGEVVDETNVILKIRLADDYFYGKVCSMLELVFANTINFFK